MFLQSLNDNQKKSFLYLAQELIKVDNKIKASELNLLKNMAEEMNIKVHDAAKIENIGEADKIFTTRQSRLITILELIAAGYIDDDFCNSENSFIKKIALAFSIPDSQLLLIEQWVKDEKALSTPMKELSAKEELSEEEKTRLEHLKKQYEELLQKFYNL
jgi:uncharacterized tellurite resistance protein B-like protein